jgi:type VI secretion system FHA domain protein
MVLVLSVLRCPEQSVPEERRVAGGEYTIGRGAECDWVLADADRVLSKKHCAVEYLAGGWQLRDLSTNGTYLNGAAHAVGRGATQPLRNGDRLRLGAWEMECRISEERGVGEGRGEAAADEEVPGGEGSHEDLRDGRRRAWARRPGGGARGWPQYATGRGGPRTARGGRPSWRGGAAPGPAR